MAFTLASIVRRGETPLKIAVVGAGISGLGAGWLLSQQHEVCLFEQNRHLGGHADTFDVVLPAGGIQPIDTGFIVYNTASYPNLVALFDYLGVVTAETDMSFAVSLAGGRYEYSGNGVSGLFAQRRNLLNPKHWGMVRDILRFFAEVSELDLSDPSEDVSIADWLHRHGYREYFVRRHIVPMGAAIWSCPANDMLRFPMASFARFFANHGLLVPDVNKRPPWRTVRSGSREYVNRVLDDFKGRYETSACVTWIERRASGVTLGFEDGHRATFDQCVIATHADEAMALLRDCDDCERELLGAFSYSTNEAVLHTDRIAMPRRRRAWASWNYIGQDGGGEDGDSLSVTYWMNRLQPLATDRDYFVTLNPSVEISAKKVLRRVSYQHPVFDREAMRAQKDLWSLQGRRHTWFAGSYFGYGFHEDGLQAGLAVGEDLGGLKRPWTVEDDRGRILSVRTGSAAGVKVAAE